MANLLQEQLNKILQEKTDKIIPSNIKNGIQIFDIVGTLDVSGDATSDATLEARYLLTGYSAIVNGNVVEGTMPERGYVTITATSEDISIPEGHYDYLNIPIINAANCDDYAECAQALMNI